MHSICIYATYVADLLALLNFIILIDTDRVDAICTTEKRLSPEIFYSLV